MALSSASFSMRKVPVALPNSALGRGFSKSVHGKEIGRRGLFSLLVAGTAMIPSNSDSKKALLQDYLERSKANKVKNDKERLDDYYKRNYKDYFGLIEGSLEGKEDELLSESEKGIRKWLQTNK